MNKVESVGKKLAALNALRDDLRSDDVRSLLRQSLGDRSNRVIERAADLIAETEDKAFVEHLLGVYRRLMINPLKNDPGCIGKTAVLRALLQLDHSDPEIFRDGIVYEQPEPVWGGRKDTAAELRATCVFGLINCASSLEVLNRSSVLLGDPCVEARVGAAQALAALAVPEGGPLLRLKLLTGDAAPEVVGECCSALLRLDREHGLDFVAKLLSSENSDVCVQAGLALGESRLPNTFGPLRVAWEQKLDNSVREDLLLCIGLLRSAEAIDFLLSLIDTKDLRAAIDSLKALKLHGKLGDLRQRTRAAVEATGDAQLASVFEEAWGDEK